MADLPIEIQEHIRDKKYSSVPVTDTDTLKASFTWSSTEEGVNFWNKVCKGKFEVFFDKYPKISGYKEWKKEKGFL